MVCDTIHLYICKTMDMINILMIYKYTLGYVQTKCKSRMISIGIKWFLNYTYRWYHTNSTPLASGAFRPQKEEVWELVWSVFFFLPLFDQSLKSAKKGRELIGGINMISAVLSNFWDKIISNFRNRVG